MLFYNQVQLHGSFLEDDILAAPSIDDDFAYLLSNGAIDAKDINLPPVFHLFGGKWALSNN